MVLNQPNMEYFAKIAQSINNALAECIQETEDKTLTETAALSEKTI